MRNKGGDSFYERALLGALIYSLDAFVALGSGQSSLNYFSNHAGERNSKNKKCNTKYLIIIFLQ